MYDDSMENTREFFPPTLLLLVSKLINEIREFLFSSQYVYIGTSLSQSIVLLGDTTISNSILEISSFLHKDHIIRPNAEIFYPWV